MQLEPNEGKGYERLTLSFFSLVGPLAMGWKSALGFFRKGWILLKYKATTSSYKNNVDSVQRLRTDQVLLAVPGNQYFLFLSTDVKASARFRRANEPWKCNQDLCQFFSTSIKLPRRITTRTELIFISLLSTREQYSYSSSYMAEVFIIMSCYSYHSISDFVVVFTVSSHQCSYSTTCKFCSIRAEYLKLK